MAVAAQSRGLPETPRLTGMSQQMAKRRASRPAM